MNKRDKIIEYIYTQIKNKKWQLGDKILSEYELADKFEVNKKTANVAVNTLVSRGILERGRGKSGTIVKNVVVYPKGVITYLGELQDFHKDIVVGAEKTARAHDYAIQYVAPPVTHLGKLWEQLKAYNISGLLTSSYGTIAEELPFPVIHIDHNVPERSAYHTVNSDNFQAGKIITEYLLSMGHRNIVFIDEYGFDPHMLNRGAGYVEAMTEAGIANSQDRVISASDTMLIAKRIKERFPMTTAIICDTDFGAVSMVKYLLEENIAIPKQMSIAGFGALTKFFPFYNVTSVEQNPQRMGAQACLRMIEMLENDNEDIIRDELPVELYIGNTCGLPCSNPVFKAK